MQWLERIFGEITLNILGRKIRPKSKGVNVWFLTIFRNGFFTLPNQRHLKVIREYSFSFKKILVRKDMYTVQFMKTFTFLESISIQENIQSLYFHFAKTKFPVIPILPFQPNI